MASDHELGKVQFLQWTALYLSEKPFQTFFDYEIPEELQDRRTTNLVFEDKEILIENIRGREQSFELDKHGFIVRNFFAPGRLPDQILNEDVVRSMYASTAEELLRTEVDGVDRLFLLDWRTRSAATSLDKVTSLDLQDRAQKMKPANSAHVDHTSLASINHVISAFPDEAEYLLQGRIRIVNVWIPLKHNVKDWPLALCDGSTVSLEEDLIDTDIVRRKYQGGNMYMIHRPTHKWYFLKDQTPTEALIFKQFDVKDVAAQVCPHVSFEQRVIPEGTLPRESLEMRFIIVTFP